MYMGFLDLEQFSQICAQEMLLSGKRLLSRGGENKTELKSFRFWVFFKLGVRSKTAQFLLTVESSYFKERQTQLCPTFSPDPAAHSCQSRPRERF